MRLLRLFRTRRYSTATAAAALAAAVACSASSPDVVAADVESTGSLTVIDCVPKPGSGVTPVPESTCGTFSGPMVNNGPGCAGTISGTTSITDVGNADVIDSANWTFTGTLADGATGRYTGGPINVPSVDQWQYHTTINFDNATCASAANGSE